MISPEDKHTASVIVAAEVIVRNIYTAMHELTISFKNRGHASEDKHRGATIWEGLEGRKGNEGKTFE